MAFRAFSIAIFIAIAVAPALATDYKVGDDKGWTFGVNYTTWAQGKDFRVGDTLSFIYVPGVHNVWKVNQTDFQQCVNSNASEVPHVTGNDTISLSSPGKKWYICGVPEHCSKGMKLVINVSDAEGPAPVPVPVPAPIPPPGVPAAGGLAPTPTPPGNSAAMEVSPLRSSVWTLAVMAAYRMIMA